MEIIKTTNEIFKCNGQEVKAMLKNYGYKPYLECDEKLLFFNVEDLCKAMGWNDKVKDFLLSQKQEEKGYVELEVIETSLPDDYKKESKEYSNWLIKEVFKIKTLMTEEVKEIDKQEFKDFALKATIGIAIVVGIALIL